MTHIHHEWKHSSWHLLVCHIYIQTMLIRQTPDEKHWPKKTCFNFRSRSIFVWQLSTERINKSNKTKVNRFEMHLIVRLDDFFINGVILILNLYYASDIHWLFWFKLFFWYYFYFWFHSNFSNILFFLVNLTVTVYSLLELVFIF